MNSFTAMRGSVKTEDHISTMLAVVIIAALTILAVICMLPTKY